MKKYIYSLALCLCVSGSLYAGNGEKYIGISGGYSLLRAIDVRLSYEMESRYHGSHELFAEFYDSLSLIHISLRRKPLSPFSVPGP